MAVEESYRLPRHARPRHYELELAPYLDEARFDGRVAITVDVEQATAVLVLNAAEIEVVSARLRTPAGEVLEPTVSTDEADQKLSLGFPAELPAGAGYRLELDYRGILNDQLRGFYRSTFRDAEGHDHVIASTQFEATDARRAFPCWDEPEFKAVFEVTLVVEDGLTGLSNGPLTATSRRDDGRVEMRFAPTMMMSTYLVAFVVGPYELTEPVDVDGTPVRIAAVPGKLAMAGYGLEVAAHALRFLTGYFGLPYPGDKLDHVAVPDFAFGAMENLGCVTYRESLLLTEPETAALTELQRITAVVAHETAHMWFGDLVTMKWWNGIWLNEAFATFMELTTSHAYRPDWEVWTAFGAGKAAAMGTDGLRATRSVEFPVGPPEEAEGMFDVLTYQKGGAVLKMLEQYLGPEVFRKGISHYLATHAYSNTETADLWDALETISGEPVRQIMDSWINQGGYPVLEVSEGPDAATVVLRQRRFLYDGTDSAERWSVPVNLRASIEGRIEHGRLLLAGGEATFSFSGPVDWLVVNDGAWGFYRTRYSRPLWDRLAAAGPASVLVPLERLQLLGDTWAAVQAGQADLSEWADIARAVAGDPDPDLWASLTAGLSMLDRVADDADRDAVRAFARELTGPAWAALGWEPRPGESDRAATARSWVLLARAGLGRDPELVAETDRRLTAYLAGDRGPGALAPDLVGAAARIAVGAGPAERWSDVLEAYRKTDRAQEQLRFLFALTETTDADQRRQTLELSLTPEVRSQDAPSAVAGILAGRGAAAEGWPWLEANWDRIVARFPQSLLLRVLEASTAFVDADVAESVRAFCASKELPVSPVRVAQVLERMGITVSLAARLRGRIAAALAPAS